MKSIGSRTAEQFSDGKVVLHQAEGGDQNTDLKQEELSLTLSNDDLEIIKEVASKKEDQWNNVRM